MFESSKPSSKRRDKKRTKGKKACIKTEMQPKKSAKRNEHKSINEQTESQRAHRLCPLKPEKRNRKKNKNKQKFMQNHTKQKQKINMKLKQKRERKKSNAKFFFKKEREKQSHMKLMHEILKLQHVEPDKSKKNRSQFLSRHHLICAAMKR